MSMCVVPLFQPISRSWLSFLECSVPETKIYIKKETSLGELRSRVISRHVTDGIKTKIELIYLHD